MVKRSLRPASTEVKPSSSGEIRCALGWGGGGAWKIHLRKAPMRVAWMATQGPARTIALPRWFEKTKKSVCMLVSKMRGGRKRKRRKCGAAASPVQRVADLDDEYDQKMCVITPMSCDRSQLGHEGEWDIRSRMRTGTWRAHLTIGKNQKELAAACTSTASILWRRRSERASPNKVSRP